MGCICSSPQPVVENAPAGHEQQSVQLVPQETAKPVASPSTVALHQEAEPEDDTRPLLKNNAEAQRAREEEEALVREAQLHALIESMKAMSIKARFRAARQQKMQAIMEEAAAIMIQNIFRARRARKRVEALKMERLLQSIKALFAKERFRAARLHGFTEIMRDAAASMVQAVWRAKLARKRVAEIRLQRRKNAAALQFQGLWKVFKAKQILKRLRKERDSAIKLQAQMRRFRVQRRFEDDLRSALRPIVVEIVQCRNIGQTHAPYVVISGTNIPKSEETPLPPTMCVAKTPVVPRPPHDNICPFNEVLAMGGIDSLGCLILTVCDKDLFSNHNIIGQAVIDLSKYPQLYSTSFVLQREMSLLGYEYVIQDSTGRAMRLGNTDVQGQGTITVRVRIPPAPTSICGWVERLGRKQLMQKQLWKNRYMILANGYLKYYGDMHTQEEAEIKGSMDMSKVTSILDLTEDGRRFIQITELDGKKEDTWKITIPGEPVAHDVWMRRIMRAAPQLPNPDVQELRAYRKK